MRTPRNNIGPAIHIHITNGFILTLNKAPSFSNNSPGIIFYDNDLDIITEGDTICDCGLMYNEK